MAISTKGISQVDLSSGIKSKNNLKSKAEEGAVDSFSSLINMSSGNFKDENKISDDSIASGKVETSNVSDKEKVNTDSDSRRDTTIADNKKSDNNKINAKDGNNVKNNDNNVSGEDSSIEAEETPAITGTLKSDVSDSTSIDEKIEDLAAELAALINQITDILKDMLGIGEEEVEETLSALDMNFTDLLNTENITEFVLYSEGATEVDILIDEQLATLVNDITADVNDALLSFETFDVTALNTEDIVSADYNEVIPLDEENVINAKEVFDRAEKIVNNSEVDEAVETQEEITVEKNDGSFIAENADNNISDGINTTVLPSQENTGSKNSSSQNFGSSNETVINNLNNAINNVIQEGVEETNTFAEGVSQADIIRQVVDEIKANITNEVSTLEMRLNPESLGKVQITVSSRNGVMQAQIVAETEAAKNAIEENIAALRESFNNQDLKVEDVEVTIASYGFFEGQEQDMPDGNESNQSNGRNIRINSDGDAMDDSSDDEQIETEMMRAQGNSVSYTV